MKVARLVLLLLLVLALPVAFASAWVGHAQLPSVAVVDMPVPTDAVVPASEEAALERSKELAMENEVQPRLICHDVEFAIGTCALAMSAQAPVRMWRTYSVILPGAELLENAIATTPSNDLKGTRGHLLL